MDYNVSLEKVEKKAYRSIHESGLIDIMVGSLLTTFTLIAILEWFGISRYLGYSLLLFPVLIHWLGQKYITTPRMGIVKFGEKRKKRTTLIRWIALVVILLMLPVVVITVGQGFPDKNIWMLVAIVGAPILVLSVLITDLPRLYLYAALILATVIESEFLRDYISQPLNEIISFGLPGMIILFVGISMLIKFIKRYPLTSDGGSDD
ncbi:hypothetical protein ACFLQG_01110 [Candidatus Zixiibacteriota bacterium]